MQVLKCVACVDTTRVKQHKYARRQAEKVITYQIAKYPITKNAPVIKNWYPIEKANTQLIKEAWVFTHLIWKLICFTAI